MSLDELQQTLFTLLLDMENRLDAEIGHDEHVAFEVAMDTIFTTIDRVMGR
jgi:hypothetical protein